MIKGATVAGIMLTLVGVVVWSLVVPKVDYWVFKKIVYYPSYSVEARGWLEPENYSPPKDLYQVAQIFSNNLYLEDEADVYFQEYWLTDAGVAFGSIKNLDIIEKTEQHLIVGDDVWTFYITDESVQYKDKQGQGGIFSDVRVKY